MRASPGRLRDAQREPCDARVRGDPLRSAGPDAVLLATFSPCRRESRTTLISLEFPELGELEHHVIRIHERDDEPLLAVAEAPFEDVIARECDGWVTQQLEPRGALALLEH